MLGYIFKKMNIAAPIIPGHASCYLIEGCALQLSDFMVDTTRKILVILRIVLVLDDMI